MFLKCSVLKPNKISNFLENVTFHVVMALTKKGEAVCRELGFKSTVGRNLTA